MRKTEHLDCFYYIKHHSVQVHSPKDDLSVKIKDMNSLRHRLQNIQILFLRKLPSSTRSSLLAAAATTALLTQRGSVAKRRRPALPPPRGSTSFAATVSPPLRRHWMRALLLLLLNLGGRDLEPRHLALQMLLALLQLAYLLEKLLRGWSLHLGTEIEIWSQRERERERERETERELNRRRWWITARWCVVCYY